MCILYGKNSFISVINVSIQTFCDNYKKIWYPPNDEKQVLIEFSWHHVRRFWLRKPKEQNLWQANGCHQKILFNHHDLWLTLDGIWRRRIKKSNASEFLCLKINLNIFNRYSDIQIILKEWKGCCKFQKKLCWKFKICTWMLDIF